MDLGLRDRVYLVTGASRGLGLAAARALVAEGGRVVMSGRTEETVTSAASELDASGRAVGVAADNGDPRTAPNCWSRRRWIGTGGSTAHW